MRLPRPAFSLVMVTALLLRNTGIADAEETAPASPAPIAGTMPPVPVSTAASVMPAAAQNRTDGLCSHPRRRRIHARIEAPRVGLLVACLPRPVRHGSGTGSRVPSDPRREAFFVPIRA
jgi:hypothetical protein